jgi:ATP-binding cassette subfamily B protein/ATP-binding cassette subfamily C protein
VPYKRIKIILLRKCENNDILKINSNNKIVLIGNTGIGKATILNLIILFDTMHPSASAGSILINDKDLYDINVKNFRSKVSRFTQYSFLFSATIEENVLEIFKICDPDNLDDKKVIENKSIFVS